MNEREAAIDTYFLVHNEVLVAIYNHTDNLIKTAPPDKVTSFDFVQNEDIPEQTDETEEKMEHAAKTAGLLEYFIRSRQQAEKVEQLRRSSPFYTADDIAAMMRYFETEQPQKVTYRSACYPNELSLTSIALHDKDDKAYARRVIIQKMDDLISETYTLTIIDDLPVTFRKEINAVNEYDQGENRDVGEFLARIDFDERPSALELRDLAQYLRDFPSLWEY